MLIPDTIVLTVSGLEVCTSLGALMAAWWLGA